MRPTPGSRRGQGSEGGALIERVLLRRCRSPTKRGVAAREATEAGDLVELDSETIDGLRYARGVSLVSAPKCSELPELLKGMAAPKGSRQPVLRVISNKSLTSDASPLPPHRVAAAG